MHKLVVASVVFLLVTLGGHSGGFGEQAPVPQGELRIVDKDPLNWACIPSTSSSTSSNSTRMAAGAAPGDLGSGWMTAPWNSNSVTG